VLPQCLFLENLLSVRNFWDKHLATFGEGDLTKHTPNDNNAYIRITHDFKNIETKLEADTQSYPLKKTYN